VPEGLLQRIARRSGAVPPPPASPLLALLGAAEASLTSWVTTVLLYIYLASGGAGAAAASSDADYRMPAAIGQLVGVAGAHAGLRPARAPRRGNTSAVAASAARGMAVVEAIPPRLGEVDG
jgi:hypothetical protein